MVGFRDPLNGIRPLIYGSRETEQGMEYIIASESVAITALGFKVERDISPGEAVFIDYEGNFFSQAMCGLNAEYLLVFLNMFTLPVLMRPLMEFLCIKPV